MPVRPNFTDRFAEYLVGPQGPLARITARQIAAKIAETESRIRALQKEPMALFRVLEFAISEVKRIKANPGKDLRSSILQLRDALTARANGYAANTNQHVAAIFGLFSEFDEDALVEAFATEFPDDASCYDPEKEIESLREQILALDADLLDAWPEDVKGLAKFFREDRVPGEYQGMQLGKNSDAQAIAKRICDDYIAEYRNRARMFSRPVTFNGILIDSLPARAKTAWMDLWKRLNISPREVSPVYLETIYSSGEDAAVPTNPMFAR